MVTVRSLLVALALSVCLLPSPILAQASDGIDNDNDGQTDEADEYDGGSPDMGRTEAQCDATGQLAPCLFAYNMFCQQFGLPGSCALAQVGNHCNGGDPAQCQYFQDLMNAKAACFAQNQAACDWYLSQPVVRVGM